MSDTVIKVEDLGKLYRLGEIGTGTISHDLNRWWAKIRGKEDPFSKIGETNDRSVKGKSDYVWALKNVGFEVKQGEVLGIIGRNGAGKSTLLKILSKVTTPSTGSIKVKGRIASLLEVGTGFHPELTGRENVFLNGAILGMSKVEIKSKFDEIVSFAGIERYIDTPVKRYSSGMYVRLAFAVAAFLEPEILIVDEVLAVGDAEFQKKCLGRMKDVSEQDGRTILFVSHDLSAIENLCSRVIYMKNGTIQMDGNTQNVVSSYISEMQRPHYELCEQLVQDVQLTFFHLHETEIESGQGIRFSLKLDYISKPVIDGLCLLIYNTMNVRVGIVDLRPNFEHLVFSKDSVRYEGLIEQLELIEGDYFFGLHYNINHLSKDIFNLCMIRVKSDLYVGNIKKYLARHRGIIEIKHSPVCL